MIQANELRRGNILAYNGGGLCEVFAIEGDSVGVIDDIDPTYESLINLHYVPLTEDILTKCGIYQSLGSPFYRKGKFAVDLLGHCEYKNVTIDAEISYIHTLQNIYFALTQQELEIKL